MRITVEVDPTVGAVYVRLSDALASRTIELSVDDTNTIMVDVDARGHPVGVEVLS